MGSVTDPREARRIVYAEIVRCAELGIEMTKNEDLAGILGNAAVSTPPYILACLERMNKIRIKRYQRSRQVYVVELDKETAEPRNTSPHWRDIKGDAPSIQIATLQAYDPPMAEAILKAARSRGQMPHEFVQELVKRGWADWKAEQVEMEMAA